MYFEQFYLGCLAHASYMIASEGVAAVVDPQRDVDFYLEEAERQGVKIAHVIETHLHADFVSGHKELADRTGAKIYFGWKAGAEFDYVGVKTGDEIEIGKVRLRFLETPGHTPESISIVVTDLEKSLEPEAVLTGDTLFIGEVGRPDLVPSSTPQEMAGQLYDSLHQKLLTLPDAVKVYPAHGAGSLCGKNIGSEKFSTIGEQRASNYALKKMSRDEFVEMLTSELPLRPEYFFRDAMMNKAGAAALADLPALTGLSPDDVEARQQAGATVLDVRPAGEFGAAHLPGSVNVPLDGQFATWTGTVLGLDSEIILLAGNEEQSAEARMRLARVGIENVTGKVEGGLAAWDGAGKPLARVQQISVAELDRMLVAGSANLQLVDVRQPGEWEAGHIEQALHHRLDHVPSPAVGPGRAEPLDDIRRDAPVIVFCRTGYRSSVASSLLLRAGFDKVMNVTGGFEACQQAKLPVVTGQPA